MITQSIKITAILCIGSIFSLTKADPTDMYHSAEDTLSMIAKQYAHLFSAQPCTPLYAPWRHSYENNETPKPKSSTCPFCTQIAAHEDDRYFILKRGQHCMIMLNLFPYGNGHLLIIPYEHKCDLHAFSQEARTEIIEFASLAWRALQVAYQFVGANIGCNIGPYSGASIPDHLHLHILPRTNGDIGFNELLARTPIITLDLRKTYITLQSILSELCPQEE